MEDEERAGPSSLALWILVGFKVGVILVLVWVIAPRSALGHEVTGYLLVIIEVCFDVPYLIGCVLYVRRKGRSGWLGLLGLLMLPGLIALMMLDRPTSIPVCTRACGSCPCVARCSRSQDRA